MKYLVLYREDTRVSATLPPMLVLEAVEATGKWLDDMRASGKVTEAGFMSGEHGGFAVVGAKSGGELADFIESCPARPFCTVETIPLMSSDENAPILAKVKVRIGEMMQKMAGMGPPR
jgi:muconolactone delta-isomerase